jgi:PAS domain S-box-containing protein
MPSTPVKRVTIDLLSLILAISLILGLSLPAFAQAQPQAALPEKNVLILHTLESSTPLTLETNRGLLDTLRIGGIPVANLFFESMDLRRNPGPELRKLLAEQMRLKWSHRKADMVITVYPEALEFVLNDCRDVFPHVPIIALHLPQNYMKAETGRRIIGHFPTYDISGTIDNALKLVPGTKRVYVVSGAHKIDKWLEDQARLASKKWEGVEFLYLSHMTIEDILATVSKAPPGSVTLYLALTRDVAGKSHRGLGLAHDLSQVSTVPVFGLFESALGYGVTGGTLISWNLIGKRAGQLVIDILKGVKTLDDVPPVLDVPSVPMFDSRQLRRWKLSEAALPKGSIVINREVTFWDFKYYIIGGIVVFLAQTLLVIGLLIQRRRKLVAEASVRQKTEEMDQFFNVNLDVLCIANTDGYFLRLNPAVEGILGYTREELMARRFLEFVHPDDLDRTQKTVSNLSSQQKVFSLENRYRCKDGTYRWLEWSAVPAGNLIYAAARDITGRKLAEEAVGERLRFEQLVSNLSAKFVNIAPDRVDSEIEDGLRQVLEFFQVDRVGLLRSLPDRSGYHITHGVYSEDVPSVPVGVGLHRSLYPWVYERLTEKHEVVSFSRVDDLPPEADVDKQKYAEWGIRSALDIPIITGGPVVHVIVINSVKSERVWPEEFFPRLQLLGEIFVNAIERKQIRLQIEERLRFEHLLSDLSAGFVNFPPEEVVPEINKGLRSITEFFDVDRCTIGLFSEDGTQLLRGFEYHSAEAEPAPESMSKEQMPWYIGQLIQGKPVLMSRVEDLPPEAEKERQLCLAKGMKSVLSIPLLSGGKTLGVCAFVSTRAERVWPEELVKRSQLLTGVFANALQRKRAEEASQESERILRQNESDLRRLAGSLIYAQEEERSRLARELHDDLAQRLAVFAIDVGRLEQQWVDPPAPAQEELRQMKENIVKISQDVHSLSRQLHPSILDDLGLIKAVESECLSFSKREGIEIAFNHEDIPTFIPKDVSLSLYRIIQEGLRNISKHACAEHISVSLKGMDHDVLLSVQDDGIGFDWAEVKEKPGLGLSSMRERARLIHGELSIQSQPGKGTLITVRVALRKEGE